MKGLVVGILKVAMDPKVLLLFQKTHCTTYIFPGEVDSPQ